MSDKRISGLMGLVGQSGDQDIQSFPGHDRRAALAAGPDVWEVVARLRELDGVEEERIEVLSAESGLHPRMVRVALDYAAAHPDEIRHRIDRNRDLAERSHRLSQQREALLV